MASVPARVSPGAQACRLQAIGNVVGIKRARPDESEKGRPTDSLLPLGSCRWCTAVKEQWVEYDYDGADCSVRPTILEPSNRLHPRQNAPSYFGATLL